MDKFFDIVEKSWKARGNFLHALPHTAIERNKARADKEVVPIPGIRGTHKRLESLRYDEGFDHLWWVELTGEGFVVREGEFHPGAAL